MTVPTPLFENPMLHRKLNSELALGDAERLHFGHLVTKLTICSRASGRRVKSSPFDSNSELRAVCRGTCGRPGLPVDQ